MHLREFDMGNTSISRLYGQLLTLEILTSEILLGKTQWGCIGCTLFFSVWYVSITFPNEILNSHRLKWLGAYSINLAYVGKLLIRTCPVWETQLYANSHGEI